MASPISPPTKPAPEYAATPAEPFGQAGVRQYAGRLIAWTLLTIGLSAAAMAQRSSNFVDVLEWRGRGQTLFVMSANSQIQVRAGSRDRSETNETGWRYTGGYNQRRWGANRGPWRTELGESIGIEATLTPPRDYDTGIQFRAHWFLLALLFLIQPLVYVVRAVLRWRRTDVAAA